MDELHVQLAQLRQAFESADEESKPGIQQLISEFEELLGQNNANTAGGPTEEQCPEELNNLNNENDDDDEYLKFQAEIAGLDSTQESDLPSEKQENVNKCEENNSINEQAETSKSQDVTEQGIDVSIEEELKALEGMKCLAPFEHHWGQIGYYNSFILCAEASEPTESVEAEPNQNSAAQIRVRVIFTQPVVESMKPCEYYMEGRCRFTDGSCKFSHGEIVSLTDLREYKDPDYTQVIPGSKVMAKYSDGLWYNAVVRKLTEEGDCEIVYNSYKDEIVTVPLHETNPINPEQEDQDESSSDNEKDKDSDSSAGNSEVDEKATPIQWIHMNGTSSLGDWEQHTKGMGSKLMMKMGYIFGTGLGKNGEGRVNPVDAVILPPGRSLDRCMELKEKAGTSGANLFSVERRLKRIKQKELRRAKVEENREKERQSVFNFLNSQLNIRKSKQKHSSNSKNQSTPTNYNKETCKDLSKNLITINSNIKLVEKDIIKCKESIKRHEGRDQITVERLKEKLNVLEYQLNEFRNNESKIAKEQSNRVAKKKLTLF